MTQRAFTDYAKTTLAGSIGSSDTSCTLATGTGALFPAAGGGTVFTATLIDTVTGTQLEQVLVTARSTDTITMTRAQNGTTAKAYAASDKFALLYCAEAVNKTAFIDQQNTFTQPQLGVTASPGDNTTKLATTAFVIANGGGVPTGAITTSGLTQSTNKLLGRGTAATGAIEEITLGTNLSLSGTTLNATGGGIGIGQTRQDMTASRAVDATPGGANVYTNSTGKPIVLSITGTLSSGYGLSLYVAGLLMQQSGNQTVTAGSWGFEATILNGETYELVSTSYTITKWYEIR